MQPASERPFSFSMVRCFGDTTATRLICDAPFEVTTGAFLRRLIDGDDLVARVLEHCEELDPKYKGLIPLKRVYVPAATECEDL